MNRARWFFEEMVKAAFAEWQRDPRSEMKVRSAAGFINDMAEWSHEHLHWSSKPDTATEFRAQMKIHGSYKILVDIANGTKHVKLKEKFKPIISNADQTSLHTFGTIDQVHDISAIDDFDSLSSWIVELDDGNRYYLRPLLEECIRMWDQFLQSNRA